MTDDFLFFIAITCPIAKLKKHSILPKLRYCHQEKYGWITRIDLIKLGIYKLYLGKLNCPIMKKTTYLFILFLLTSCGGAGIKTAKDIKLDKIKTPCEWLKCYNIAVSEYLSFLLAKKESFTQDVKKAPVSEGEITSFEETKNFYVKLVEDLKALQKTKGWDDGVSVNSCSKEIKYENVINDYAKATNEVLPQIELIMYPGAKEATAYLKALMKKDFDIAKTLATKETAQNLDMMKSLGTDFGLTDVKDVKCRAEGDKATCTFCCTTDTSFKELKMQREGDKWLAHQPKETPPTEENQ